MKNNFSHGLAAIKNRNTGKWGYIDQDYKLVIPCKYEEAMGFNIFGHASVKLKGRWGMINKRNELLILEHRNVNDLMFFTFEV